MICPLCGRKVEPNKGNATIINSYVCHKKCPTDSNKLSEYEKEKYDLLKKKISYYASTCPRGHISEKPMNFKYAMIIVSKMKERGFTYDDIIYALDKVVELQNGFWGMGAVDNRIEVVIDKRNKLQEKQKRAEQTNESKEKVYDLSDMIKDKEDEWI